MTKSDFETWQESVDNMTSDNVWSNEFIKASYHMNFDIIEAIIVYLGGIKYKITIDQPFINKVRSVLEQLGAEIVHDKNDKPS